VDRELEALKIPPHSLEAEQSVLGGLLLDNQAWDKVVDRLQERDFYRQEHRIIFRIIVELANRSKPFDVITLTDALKNINELANVGGEVYLFELVHNTPTAANIGAYADIVRERSVLRQLIAVAGDISASAFLPGSRDSAELLDDAERKVFQIAQHGIHATGPISISDLLAKAVERIDALFHSKQGITGLATCFHDLDKMTSGLQPADLVIIAGRPSMGKTAFAINIAENIAIKHEKPVLVFSMEMPGEALAMRMISSLGRINQQNLRTGKLQDQDWPRINSAITLLTNKQFYIDDTPALSPGELRSRARRVMREQGQLGLIVIDYLQLMQVPGSRENRTTEISEISRSLKALAKELNVPVLALSQLNRGLEQRTDKRPMMSDLRESGAIEQDADLILFIYRDEVYNKESPDKGRAEIIIAKQRNGPIGSFSLTFLGEYTRFENFAPTSYSDNGFAVSNKVDAYEALPYG
jgi:replicative DNA helicase